MAGRIGRVAVLAVLGLTGCGLHFFDRFDGRPVRARQIAAPPASVWAELAQGARSLDLLISEISPEDRVLQLDWVTAPGDGRLYLRCQDSRVGSASLRSRLHVRESGAGSSIVVASEVRATASGSCESTGRFEEWLLGQLDPAMAQVAAAASSRAHVQEDPQP
ncbi:MAG: hypothetical protein HY561_04000 [Gemmatimonadetes bacterium]|nr:hypothetical protein [Gemmatimonadota bacterium]